MSVKIVLFCVQICLIKTALSQCLGANPAVVAAGATGWPLLLESYPMPPTGLSIAADDLIIEGLVSVCGNLPFLGSVAVEGLLPTEGQGSVVYGCGNGEVTITGENVGPYGPSGYGAPLPGPGFPGPGFPGPGFPGPGFAGPMGPAFPFAAACGAPAIDPGMAAAANTAAMAAAANSAGQAAVRTSMGIGAAAAASGLTAMSGL